jgi:hypothetical protein
MSKRILLIRAASNIVHTMPGLADECIVDQAGMTGCDCQQTLPMSTKVSTAPWLLTSIVHVCPVSWGFGAMKPR